MSSKEYFNNVATEWDEMREGFFSKNLRVKVCNAANVKAGENAADIGAGSGFLTEELVNRNVNVIAVDQSDSMVRVLKEKFGTVSLVKVVLADGENLPIEDGSLDYVFANMYLHHVEDPRAAIKEMTRVLKNGGKVILSDLDKHNFTFLKEEQNDVWMGFERSDIEKWFIESGLKNVKIDCAKEDCCSDSCCKNESAKISIFIGYGEK